jgi:hypothetical protein
MRISIMPVMEFDDEFLLYSVESVLDSVDYLLFSVNTRSWGNSDIKLTDENKQFIEEFVKTNSKFKLLMGTWESEHLQHNAGTDYAISLGADLVFCTSTDQVYGEGDVKKMLDILENSDADILRVQWYTFWKTSPLYVVWPPEPFNPVLAFKPKQFRYSDVSEGRAVDKDGNLVDPKTISLSINDVKVFHFSFARSDEFVKHKMEMSSHRHQMIPDWYETTWLKFKPEMTNFHPCFPGCYQKAIPFPLEQLPPRIRGYFKMQQQKKIWQDMK